LSKPHSGADPLSPAQKAKIRETLDRVSASQAFRKSDQCRRFLQYVVEQSCGAEEESLRERIIGMEVFGRPADYDTADDPVVRVRANEVRKRLAQYSVVAHGADEVRFEIPAGSYRVEFQWHPAGAPETAAPRLGKARWRWWMAAGVGVGMLAGAAAVLRLSLSPAPASPLEQFWAPVLTGQRPVIIYCGQPVVYFLSRAVHEKFRQTLPADKQRGAYAVTLDSEAALRGSDVIPVTDQFVGIGNAHASALLSAMLATRRKTVEIRYANDLSFSDLRSSPAVLIGAFSNFWTLEMQGQLRFVFEQDQGVRRIRDRSNNETWQLKNLAPDGKTPEDYALVSRLLNSGTGQLLISAAGITQYGTRAAGEFLTDASLVRQATAKFAKGWGARNVQVLLHTNVYRGTPGPPTIVATHVW
jgi:hypothetical protein